MIRDALPRTGRLLLLTLRNPAALVGAAFLPLVLLVLMTLAFARIVMPGASRGEYVTFALPLYVVMGILFAAMITGAQTFTDLQSGIDRRIRTYPIAAVAPLLARVLADGLRNVVTVALVLGVGVALGFRFAAGLVEALAFVAVPLVFGVGVATAMVALAVHVQVGESLASALSIVLLVLSFLSTGMVPLEQLPGWAQPVVAVNPISTVVDAMRGFATGAPDGPALVGAAVWSLVLIAGGGSIGVRGYRRRGERPLTGPGRRAPAQIPCSWDRHGRATASRCRPGRARGSQEAPRGRRY